MNYKLVPIFPSITDLKGANDVAKDLENIIHNHTAEGWEYVRVEMLTTHVKGDSGCFGFGAKPGYDINLHLVVFRKL